MGSERLGAFDAVLAATAIARDADALVSADTALAGIPGIQILPLDGRALSERLS